MQNVRKITGGVVFICDQCLKQLDDQDQGQFYWADYEKFLDTVGSEDEEATLLLCRRCRYSYPPLPASRWSSFSIFTVARVSR